MSLLEGVWKLVARLPPYRGVFRLRNFVGAVIGPVAVEARSGVRLVARVQSLQDRYSVLAEPFADVPLREMSDLPAGCTVFDIGANIGLHSFVAARRAGRRGRVLAFEPSPREYSRLLLGIQANNFTNIVPVRCALGAEWGQAILAVERSHTGRNRIVAGGRPGDDGFTEVPVAPLDHFLAEFPEVELVKIDVEGLEMEVIRGMEAALQRRSVRRLVVEVTPHALLQNGSTREELYAHLRDRGYSPTVDLHLWQYDEVFVRDAPWR